MQVGAERLIKEALQGISLFLWPIPPRQGPGTYTPIHECVFQPQTWNSRPLSISETALTWAFS